MFKMELLAAAVVLGLAGLACAGEGGRPRIDKTTPWLCYYGDDRRVLEAPDYKLLILESDAIGDLAPEDKNGRVCVAYMTVGEASPYRWYWPDIKDKDWVLEPNPQWPDSRRVDPRSPEWQSLLLDEVAPAIMSLGYDGFFLDNVDNAEIIMEMKPETFAGADAATVDMIKGLRERFPDSVIIANNGLSIVPRVAEQIDAVMYEGTVSTWKERADGGYDYVETSPKQRAWVAPRLARVKKAGLTVLALEYVAPGDAAAEKKVRDAVVRAGNNPYLATRELDTFPGSDKLPPLPDDEEE